MGSLLDLILNNPSPPFHYIFMFLWIRLFGDSELSVRMPPLVFGIVSILLTYTLASRFIGKKGALLTSFLLCVSPVHIWYSQEARPYSGTLFFLLLAIFSYYKLKDSGSNSIWYLVYFGSLFSAVFSHFYVSVYLAIISIMCLVKRNRMMRKVLILNILILVCLISYLGFRVIFSHLSTGLGYLRPFTFFELWMLFFNWFLFGNSLWDINPYRHNLNIILHKPLMFCTQVVFLAFLMYGVTQIFKESKKREDLDSLDLMFYLFSLPLLLLGLNFIGFKNTYIERSLYVLLPFFYIVLIKGIAGFKVKSISTAFVTFTIMLSVITITSFFNKSDQWTVYKPKPDWRDASYYFDNELKNTTNRLLAFATSPATELSYYDSPSKEFIFIDKDQFNNLKRLQQVSGGIIIGNKYFIKSLFLDLDKYIRFRTEGIANPQLLIFYYNENLYEILSVNNVRTFYLIHNIYWSKDFKDLLEVAMKDPRFQFVNTQSFKGIEIFKFRVVS